MGSGLTARGLAGAALRAVMLGALALAFSWVGAGVARAAWQNTITYVFPGDASAFTANPEKVDGCAVEAAPVYGGGTGALTCDEGEGSWAGPHALTIGDWRVCGVATGSGFLEAHDPLGALFYSAAATGGAEVCMVFNVADAADWWVGVAGNSGADFQALTLQQWVEPEPTPEPTPAPTAAPTAEPTAAPTAAPTAEPTAAPTSGPGLAGCTVEAPCAVYLGDEDRDVIRLGSFATVVVGAMLVFTLAIVAFAQVRR